jgi:hypothetical protein
MKSILVVGDKFERFSADKDNVMTVSELTQRAWQDGLPRECDIWLGQGIEHDRLFGVLGALEKRNPRDSIRVANLQHMLDQADPMHQASVHKARRENVLITRPQKTGDQTFEAWLSLQDSGELLGDHVTGQHVQGMLLIEAARQMMLAVSELYLLGRNADTRFYFVLNSVNTDYLQFAFPIPTRILHEIVSLPSDTSKQLKATSRTSFYQNDVLTACVEIVYSAYPEARISDKEAKLANEAYAKHINILDGITASP